MNIFAAGYELKPNDYDEHVLSQNPFPFRSSGLPDARTGGRRRGGTGQSGLLRALPG